MLLNIMARTLLDVASGVILLAACCCLRLAQFFAVVARFLARVVCKIRGVKCDVK